MNNKTECLLTKASKQINKQTKTKKVILNKDEIKENLNIRWKNLSFKKNSFGK